jgi:hypothetical protein
MDDQDIPALGDPNTVANHDGSVYCMDLSSPAAGVICAKNYIPWYKFLREQKQEDSDYFESLQHKTKINDRSFTHTSMNGMVGGFYVENDTQFLKVYARMWASVSSREKLYIVEKPTPVFRLFMDFDFKQYKGLKPTSIEAVAQVCHTAVKSFWPHAQECIVCCSNYTKAHGTLNSVRVELEKTGIHLHWPEVYTTTEMLLHLRESILADMMRVFKYRSPPMNAWEDVFDLAPYDKGGKLGSGLRLVGSLKAEICPDRHGRKVCEKTCRCHGKGRITADGHGRPYMLFCVLMNGERSPEREAEYLKSFESLVLNTSMRYQGPETPGTIPEGAPLYIPQMEEKKRKATTRAKEVVHGDAVYEACQVAIRSNFQFAQVVVTNVAKKQDGFLVNVSGINSRFCYNVGREHKSNRVWFWVTRSGVVQKCYDDGESPDMKHGPCRTYMSSSWPLPSESNKVLYPAETDTCVTFVHKSTSHQETAEHLRKLVEYGDRLAKDLFNTSYSATLVFDNARLVHNGYKKGMSEYILHYPDHIGSGHNDAMRALGKPVEDMQDLEECTELVIPGIHSFLELEENVLSALIDLVDFACFEDKLNEFATFTYELVPSAKRRALNK